MGRSEVESPGDERKELSRESSHENISEGGEDSWEDVATTSGNESADCSDADVTRKSDSSDKSIPRDQHLDDGSTEETSQSTATNGRKSEKLDVAEGGGAGPGENSGKTEGFEDEIGEEAEVKQSEEFCKGVEEEGDSGDMAVHGECDELPSTARARELCDKEMASVDAAELRNKAEVTREEERESLEVGDGSAVEAEEDERMRAKGDVSSARAEDGESQGENAELSFREDLVATPKESGKEEAILGNNLSAENGANESPLRTSTGLPQSPQEKNDAQDLKVAGMGEEKNKMISNEVTVAGFVGEGVSSSERKDVSDCPPVSSDNCSSNT